MNELRDKVVGDIAQILMAHDEPPCALAYRILAIPEIAEALSLRGEIAEIKVIDLANLKPKDPPFDPQDGWAIG